MAIVIKEILSNDVNLVNKLNFNFDQIMLSGGGPIGPTGATGEGIPGERGKRGLNIYTFSNIPQDGTTFIGDIYIGASGASGFDRGKVYVIGTTGATSGTYTNLNLTGATGDKGATGNTGYSGGIELYAAGLTSDYGGVEGIPILSEVDNNNVIIGIGATGVNADEIGFMMPTKQRVGYIFANKYFTSAQNDKFLNLNRHLTASSGTLATINTNSTFKNLTPKSIFIQDELNLVTNNGISFGTYNLKSKYEFPANNALQLTGGNETNPRIGYSTSATSDFIDFVNFGFRLKSVSTSSPYKYVTEYLINSESIPITISAGGIKGSTASRREPSDLTLRANRIIFETYNGKSGYYATSGTFINNTSYTEANKILFKSPSYFISPVNITNDERSLIITHTLPTLTYTNLMEVIDFSVTPSNIAIKASSVRGTAIHANSDYGIALDVNGVSQFDNNINGTNLILSGDLGAGGSIDVSQNLTVNDTIYTAYLSATDNVSLGANLDVFGTLGVTGAASFKNHVSILNTKNLTCGPIIATSGSFSSNVGIVGALGVTGAATFKNNVKIDGVIGINTEPDVNFKLKVSGNSYLDGGLSIGTNTLDSHKLKVAGTSYFESSSAIALQINNIANNKALYIGVGRSEFGKVGIGADNTSSDILRVTGSSYFSDVTTFNALVTLNSGLVIPNGGVMTANYAKGNISGHTPVNGYVPAIKAFCSFTTNGRGAPTLQTSYNILSVARQSEGNYLVTLSTPTITQYSPILVTSNYNGSNGVIANSYYNSSTQFTIELHTAGGATIDAGYISCLILNL